MFATAGVGALTIGALRASRQVVLPLWADHIGLGPERVALIFGLSAAMDMTLFYPAGYVMDRFGRKFVAIPCLTILAVGQILVPLTHEFWSLALVGVLLGFGNGMGSGIVMTLGADFSPAVGRAGFLGVWRFIGDAGTAGGPLLVGAVAGLATLGAASVVIGAVGLAGAVLHGRADAGATPADPGGRGGPDRGPGREPVTVCPDRMRRAAAGPTNPFWRPVRVARTGGAKRRRRTRTVPYIARTVRIPTPASMSVNASLISSSGRRCVINPSRSSCPARQSATMRGMSRSELQLPRKQPTSFFSSMPNSTAGLTVMAWSTLGAPTSTVVPPGRVAAIPTSASAARPAHSNA